MKKKLSTLAAILLALSLCACAGAPAQETPAGPPPAPAETERPAEKEPPESGPKALPELPEFDPGNELPLQPPPAPEDGAAPGSSSQLIRPGAAVPSGPVTGEGLLQGIPYSFSAQVFRTNGYVDGAQYPQTRMICSPAELQEYIGSCRGLYAMDPVEEAAGAYDGEWFASHRLLIVLLEEGSGSVRHEVTRLTDEYISIDCAIPAVGTMDMAEWHILVETDASFAPSEGFRVVFTQSRAEKHPDTK